jgi:hypothetical protein
MVFAAVVVSEVVSVAVATTDTLMKLGVVEGRVRRDADCDARVDVTLTVHEESAAAAMRRYTAVRMLLPVLLVWTTVQPLGVVMVGDAASRLSCAVTVMNMWSPVTTPVGFAIRTDVAPFDVALLLPFVRNWSGKVAAAGASVA